MRLSEAIAMGRVVLEPTPGKLNDGEGHGCALGMGLQAIGQNNSCLFTFWPWLNNPRQEIDYPCFCFPVRATVGYSAITHLFDYHIFILKDWTLDQLIDWVRANEPAEAHAEEKTIAESAPSLVAQG